VDRREDTARSGNTVGHRYSVRSASRDDVGGDRLSVPVTPIPVGVAGYRIGKRVQLVEDGERD